MASGGTGKVVLYVVLGIAIIGLVIAVQLLKWLLSAVFSLIWYAIVVGVIVGVRALVIRAARRSVGGSNRRQLPR